MYKIPYPPSVNHIYARTKRGGVMLNPKAKAYREEVIYSIGKGNTTMTGRLRVQVDVYMPDNRKRDLDNIQKAIFDSMTHAGVWEDDSQIDDLMVLRRGVEPPGHVIVSVSLI